MDFTNPGAVCERHLLGLISLGMGTRSSDAAGGWDRENHHGERAEICFLALIACE